MRIFDLLAIMNPSIEPTETKVHLATTGSCGDDPLDLYRIGQFEEWQRVQTKKNFERKFVLSLISLPGQDSWLFAGVYHSSGAKSREMNERFDSPPSRPRHPEYYYELTEDQNCKEMNGRLVVTFSRPGRQSYLDAENWSDEIVLSEIFAEQVAIGEFPGFKAVNLPQDELELIIQKSLDSWRTALSNVAGVYLISDTTSGKLYVGSAYGEQGIWQRWSSYADNGHGGNIELQKLLADEGAEYAKKFRYSILEISDLHASRDDILKRESHWKDILMSRTHGLNDN